jgi:hypothetical protein
MFVGEILGVVSDDDILGETGMPDVSKARPFVWGSSPRMGYYSLGEPVGYGFSSGKEIQR